MNQLHSVCQNIPVLSFFTPTHLIIIFELIVFAIFALKLILVVLKKTQSKWNRLFLILDILAFLSLSLIVSLILGSSFYWLGWMAFVIGVFLMLVLWGGVSEISQLVSDLSRKIILSLANALEFLAFSLVSLIILAISFLGGDNPPSADYHVLNAAIKNTCYLDPTHNHCPHSAQDLIAIEPQDFIGLTKNAHLTYQYYPQTNQYTLIVRNNNYQYNNDRVAIFDPRLASTSGYGYKGLDFYDAEIVNNCDGTFRLSNPPPFSGPWNKIN